MLLAEELLLLCTDDVTGKKTVGGDQLDAALGGAMLTELVLAGRIAITGPQAGWRNGEQQNDHGAPGRAAARLVAGGGS